ncbi:hypothetical protein DESC_480268 [Desulfosarcina cetonica]|nr:hypothetical protein DESC_480268 [Desulfosarcina cetonica]
MGADVGLDHLLAGVGAHELVVPGDDHVFQATDKIGDFLDPDLVSDVDAAMTDVESDSDRHGRSP